MFHPKSGAVLTRKWCGLPDSFLRQRRVDERMRIIIANEDSYECFFIYEGEAGEAGEACL